MVGIPAELEGVLSSDPEIVSGEICFIGTRVPVWIFLDNVAAGISLEEFSESYPRVSDEQQRRVLEWQLRVAREAMGLRQAA